jgi:hypothetical protein
MYYIISAEKKRTPKWWRTWMEKRAFRSSSAGRIESFKSLKKNTVEITTWRFLTNFLRFSLSLSLRVPSAFYCRVCQLCVYYFIAHTSRRHTEQFNGIISISIRSSSAYYIQAQCCGSSTISLADGGNCWPWVIVPSFFLFFFSVLHRERRVHW